MHSQVALIKDLQMPNAYVDLKKPIKLRKFVK